MVLCLIDIHSIPFHMRCARPPFLCFPAKIKLISFTKGSLLSFLILFLPFIVSGLVKNCCFVARILQDILEFRWACMERLPSLLPIDSSRITAAINLV